LSPSCWHCRCYLLVFFRSLLLPAKAVVMNLLATAAALGLTVFVFQFGHGAHLLRFTSVGILQTYLPVALFAVLFGLSMDYEVFLVRRMQEEWRRGRDNSNTVATAIAHTGRQITAAATIMVAVFGSFLAADVLELQQFGFALAVAVLIDATAVRLLLVPAIMAVAIRANWWLPARLARLLPAARSSEAQPRGFLFGKRRTAVLVLVCEGGPRGRVTLPVSWTKTSIMDIAVFVAAATVRQTGPERLDRRRCFFVVDRRIVVDEAYEHAARLARALTAAERDGDAGVLGRVAAGLRAYAPHSNRGELTSVTRMRGGVTWSAAWPDRPDRPGIVLATVDQVGSRLLFRGYGVSDRRRPIDAALTGTDALLLVDEAHLSTALLSTLAAADKRDRLGVPLPGLSVVRLSATGAPSAYNFRLDVDAHRGDGEAWQRLTAAKAMSIREATGKDCPRVLAEVAVEQLTTLAGQQSPRGPAPMVLVVCNTVDRARAVHGLLRKQLSGRKVAVKADCDLLIGRSRPIDRVLAEKCRPGRSGGVLVFVNDAAEAVMPVDVQQGELVGVGDRFGQRL
jgi:hypothetical protein